MGNANVWSNQNKWEKQKILEELRFRRTPWYIGLAASLFGVTITHPIDLARVNIQANALEHANSTKIIKILVLQGGIKGLYFAFPGSIIKNLFQSSTVFLISHTTNKKTTALTVGEHINISLFGGFINSVIGTPFVKVGTIMQSDFGRTKLPKRNFRNVSYGLRTLYRKGGWSYLYQGASLQFLHGCVMTLGELLAFDLIKSEMKKRNRELARWKVNFISSTLAATSVSLVLMPTTLVRVILMNGDVGQFKSISDVCKRLKDLRGYNGFTIGAPITLLRIIPHSFLVAYAYHYLIQKFVT